MFSNSTTFLWGAADHIITEYSEVWMCLGFLDQFPVPTVLLTCFGHGYMSHQRLQRALNHNSKLFFLL